MPLTGMKEDMNSAIYLPMQEAIMLCYCTLPPPVNRPIRPRPTTKPKTPKPLPEGEEGRINLKNKVAPQPDLTTKPAVELTKPVVKLTTKAVENCSEVCPLIFEPVCATDGKDYPNLCVFEASKCTGNTDKSVTVDYYGLCEDSPTTPPVGNLDSTSSYRYCPEDVCEDTPNYVCGTDGKTYLNKCSLLKVACAGGNSSNLDIEYEGECRSLDVTVSPEGEGNTTMEPLPTPKRSQEMTTADPCANPTCEVVWQPVCANDGKTYPSQCVVDNINLCSGITITVLYNGECVKSTTASKCPTCPPLQLDPVCGTDNISYPSRCIIQKYNCESNMDIEVAYEGECLRGDI
ncbi:ovoinhibitor-like [Anneissia japonica]|uniref:ovoinhibitor-like n=1 Tax=Anneissia japonica TaxID=1529436 RepID=UPI00142577F8|nr:ovoinhibitor-like [Anneissia japonica]